MVKVTTDRFAEAARQEAERAMSQAGRRAEYARSGLGKVVLDVTDEYFPEAVRARRRRDMAAGFAAGSAVGLGVGFIASYALRR